MIVAPKKDSWQPATLAVRNWQKLLHTCTWNKNNLWTTGPSRVFVKDLLEDLERVVVVIVVVGEMRRGERERERERSPACAAEELYCMWPAVGPRAFHGFPPTERHISALSYVSHWLTRLPERPPGGRSLTKLHSLGDGHEAPCLFHGDLYHSHCTLQYPCLIRFTHRMRS